MRKKPSYVSCWRLNRRPISGNSTERLTREQKKQKRLIQSKEKNFGLLQNLEHLFSYCWEKEKFFSLELKVTWPWEGENSALVPVKVFWNYSSFVFLFFSQKKTTMLRLIFFHEKKYWAGRGSNWWFPGNQKVYFRHRQRFYSNPTEKNISSFFGRPTKKDERALQFRNFVQNGILHGVGFLNIPGKGVPYVSVRFKGEATMFFKNFELTNFKEPLLFCFWFK